VGQVDTKRALFASAALALAFFASCRVDEPVLPTGGVGSDAAQATGDVALSPTSGSTSTLTAPIISDPLSGSSVSESRPTLTVLNSARTGGETPTYLFQVSADSGFTVLEAQSTQIPEGDSGSTSWQIDRELDDGHHFWRVRARSGVTDSDFSATADFTIGSSTTAPPPPSPTSGVLLSDPLIGGSLGEVSGGDFTSGGWQVRSPADYIRYEVPPLESGWVEFDTSGLRQINGSPDQFMLFGMWDPSAGDYRQNPFRVHLQKLHPEPHNPPYLRVRWISNGEQHDEGSNFYAWDPYQTYHWRIEWGPSGGAQQARVFLDGQVMIRIDYQRPYRPAVHWIELGVAERGESVVGAKYSNFRVGQ
jgi:hypothetical protein